MMTNRERLEENAADSILALLMDDYAQCEGERYIKENEQLQADPEAEVPEEIERRALQRIEREFNNNGRQQRLHSVMHLLGRVAIAALIAVLLFTAAFALSPQFRAGTLNLLMRIDEKAATWQFIPEEQNEYNSFDVDNEMIDIEIGWLPEGYERNDPLYSGPSDLLINCVNDDGSSIRVSVHTSENELHSLDIEDADDYEAVSIRGNEGMLIIKDGICRIDWSYEDSGYVICIASGSVNTDALIHIAESVSIVN